MSSINEIDNAEEWHWYKARLDTDAKYKHRHEGAPDKFPCLVRSEWADDPNGPYYYTHYFTYQKEVTCEKCGHRTEEWDHEHTS